MSCSCARSQQVGAVRAEDAMFKLEDLLLRGDPALLVSWVQDEKLTYSTLTRLDQLVAKELSRGRFTGVTVVLKALCILMENRDDFQTLLRLRLLAKVVLWFEAVRETLTSDLCRNSTSLHSLTDDFFDFFLLLAQASLPVSQLSVLLLLLAQLSLDGEIQFPLRLEAIRTFNSILESLSREQRKLVQNNQSHSHIMSQMAAAVITVGDYQLQVSLSEALCRLTPPRFRQERANHWFSSNIRDAFCRIKDADFEVDCRHFLNFMNDYFGDERRVYTFPCLRAFVNSTQLFRPRDDKLEEFWVDFNIESRCVSFFVDDPQESLWGTVHLLKDEVDFYNVHILHDETVLSVKLKKPITYQASRGQVVELTFSSEHHSEVEQVLKRIFESSTPRLGAVGTVQTSSSEAKHSSPSYSRRKLPRKSRLKVLPLSSSSSREDCVPMRDPRSQAEILFDALTQKYPSVDMPTIGAECFASREERAEFRMDISPKRRLICDSPEVAGLTSDEEGLVEQEAWSVPETHMEPVTDLKSDVTVAFKTMRLQLETHFTESWCKVEAEVEFPSADCQQHVASMLTDAHRRRQLLLQMSERVADQLNRIEEQCQTLNSINTIISRFVQLERRRLDSFCEEVLQKLNLLKVDS